MDLNDKIEKILEKVQKAPRYTGGEMNTAVKAWGECPLHFGFCFPDTYEVGMSHLGLKILYGLINRESWSLCERFFMPWTDMMALMEEEKLPLLSMESRHPLNEFDVVGFTLQYEMSFSNILAMLKMGGIPLEGKDRGEEDPIVVAGGLADFIDAFMIGDGEDVMTELNRVILERKEKGLSREQCLKNLSKLEGVYVPSLYDVAYNENGTVASVKPNCPEAPASVKKRVVVDLNSNTIRKSFPYPIRKSFSTGSCWKSCAAAHAAAASARPVSFTGRSGNAVWKS